MKIIGKTSDGKEFVLTVEHHSELRPLDSGFKVLVISIDGGEKCRLNLSALSAVGLSAGLGFENPLD